MSDAGDEPFCAAKGALVSDGDSTVLRRGDEACFIFAATARRIVGHDPRVRLAIKLNASNISPQRKRPPPPAARATSRPQIKPGRR